MNWNKIKDFFWWLPYGAAVLGILILNALIYWGIFELAKWVWNK